MIRVEVLSKNDLAVETLSLTNSQTMGRTAVHFAVVLGISRSTSRMYFSAECLVILFFL